jgi:hypothetical protein
MRKRSKYKPKGVRLDNMAWVQSGLKKVIEVEDHGTTLMIKNHAALDEILFGRGTREHVDILIAAANITEALAQDKDLGQDWQDEIRAAQDAILAMAQRGWKGGSFVFTGIEMQSVKTLMALHDEQLQNCTVQRMEQALAMVASIIRNKKARVIIKEEAMA